MKRSEKLFLAINEIDGEIVEEARTKEETPILMKPEPRSPIKGIIALAACVAVLAVGIFAIVKFKTGGEVDPIQNASSEVSDPSSDSSSGDSFENNSDLYFETEDGLKIPKEFTEEDRELQEILKDIKAGVDDLNKLFIKRTDMNEPYYYFYYGSDHHKYYLIPENRKTDPNKLFAIPQTRAEMEDLLLEYFAAEAAEKLMSEVHKGSMIKTTEGTFINFDGEEKGFSKFIEVDGKMYVDAETDNSPFVWMHKDPPYFMVCETAKVISRTGDTIYFSYISSYSNNIDPLTEYMTYTESFANVECSLKFERGGWKLNYYYDENNHETPTDTPKEFTGSAEDKEVFETLMPLIENSGEITGMFSEMHTYRDGLLFKFNCGGSSFEETFFPISEGQRTEPNGLFSVPLTYAEMENLLSTCLTPQAAASYMEYVGKGSLTDNFDGSHTLKFDDGYEPTFPTFVEIDGRLYRSFSFSDRKRTIDPYTAKLTFKTDNTIEFTYEHTDSWGHEDGIRDGVLVNDGSGWKMNYYNDWGFMPVFTEDDLELQAILAELAPGGELIAGWVGYGHYDPDHTYRFKFSDSDKYGYEYDLIPVGKASDSGIEYPRTCEELEALMLKYLTQKIVDNNMMGVYKGTMTENSDGTYTVTVEGEPAYYDFIEIDGRLYVQNKARGGAGVPVWDSAKIIEKTDNYIKFSYVHEHMTGHYRDEGLIKYERGGWRLSYNWRGFILDDE